MKSLDTNILIYASNKNCSEYQSACAVLEEALRHKSEWIIADQVMFEFLRALSSKHIFTKPLTKDRAVKAVREFRRDSGLSFCAYDSVIFDRIIARHSKSQKDRLYDIILAETLSYHGVKSFFTRNTKDFQGMGFEQLVNPID